MNVRLERVQVEDRSPTQPRWANYGSFQIQSASGIKRSEEMGLRTQPVEDQGLLVDFIESGERLFDKLRELLTTRGKPMILTVRMVATETKVIQTGSKKSVEFVETMFGRERRR